ncbi:MAG: hypothetical protein JNN01_06410 [Opitutaceae bacterium]|nr:hypothetical protein [Opitutaceae bacterium]
MTHQPRLSLLESASDDENAEPNHQTELRQAASVSSDVGNKMRTHSASTDLVHSLLKQVESSVPSSSHLAVKEVSPTGFSIQVGSSSKACVTVSICDAKIPSFAATYPALKRDRRKGAETIEERMSTDMLAGAVVWIVRKVFRYGFVPPEGYRKNQDNRGRPNLKTLQRTRAVPASLS